MISAMWGTVDSALSRTSLGCITKKDSASFETFSGAGKKITCNSVVSTEYDNRVQTISKRFGAVLDNGESNSRQRRVNLCADPLNNATWSYICNTECAK